MNLKQITPDRSTDSRFLMHEALDRKLLVKVFLGENREQRKELEGQKMSHWKDAGFCVPELFDLPIPDVIDPYIVMEFIAGDTLKNFLICATTALELRLNTLSGLFRSNYRRHMQVRARRDLMLVHTDPNTDNIIVRGNDFYFIDFEHGSKVKDVTTATANEVGTFARRIVKDLGVEHCAKVVERLLAAYEWDAEIFDKIEDLTLGRPFQPLHRIKDRLRRLKNSRIPTRYDVADCIRQLRRRATRSQPAN